MRRAINAAFIAGVAGPSLFAVTVVMLSILERDFMATLGWDPLTAPTRDWPSGLALGPLGLIMTAVFVLSGLLLAVFAMGISRAFRSKRGGRLTSVLLGLAGLALSFLAFPTDPTNRHAPATWHGLLHDAAFAVLGAVLCLFLLAFGVVYRAAARGRGLSIFSWATAALIVPSFTVKGIVFYAFLAAFLSWCVVTALAMRKSVIQDESSSLELH